MMTQEEVLASLEEAFSPTEAPPNSLCFREVMKQFGCAESTARQKMRYLISKGWQAVDVAEGKSRTRYILPPDRRVNVTHAKNAKDDAHE